MDTEVSGDGVGHESDVRFAAFEARLHVLENRLVQIEAQMREEMASVYRAGAFHGRLLSKLSAAVQVIQQLMERIYRTVQHKKEKMEPE